MPFESHIVNMYLADMEESIKRKEVGGIFLDKIKVWLIMYMDNVVLLSESKEEMKEI